MWTTINKHKIKVNLAKKLEDALDVECPAGLEYDPDSKELTVEFSDEGFNLEDLVPYLKCALKKGKFKVHIEDHKGETHYFVQYGPGYFEEN